jgi:hypothetical protein
VRGGGGGGGGERGAAAGGLEVARGGARKRAWRPYAVRRLPHTHTCTLLAPNPLSLFLPPSPSTLSSLAARLLREGEEELTTWIHPDMWTNPYMPGGSKFMRNPPPPLRAIFPDGIPEEYNLAPKDVNGIQVPMSATPGGMQTVLIDLCVGSRGGARRAMRGARSAQGLTHPTLPPPFLTPRSMSKKAQ